MLSRSILNIKKLGILVYFRYYEPSIKQNFGSKDQKKALLHSTKVHIFINLQKQQALLILTHAF